MGTPTVALQLLEYTKNEGEATVGVTCQLLINGVVKGSEYYRLIEADLPPRWDEADLLAAIAKHPTTVALGVSVTRGTAIGII